MSPKWRHFMYVHCADPDNCTYIKCRPNGDIYCTYTVLQPQPEFCKVFVRTLLCCLALDTGLSAEAIRIQIRIFLNEFIMSTFLDSSDSDTDINGNSPRAKCDALSVTEESHAQDQDEEYERSIQESEAEMHPISQHHLRDVLSVTEESHVQDQSEEHVKSFQASPGNSQISQVSGYEMAVAKDPLLPLLFCPMQVTSPNQAHALRGSQVHTPVESLRNIAAGLQGLSVDEFTMVFPFFCAIQLSFVSLNTFLLFICVGLRRTVHPSIKRCRPVDEIV